MRTLVHKGQLYEEDSPRGLGIERILVLASLTFMAFAVSTPATVNATTVQVQHNQGVGTGHSPLLLPLGSNVSYGDLLVVLAGSTTNGTVLSVNDTQGNVWNSIETTCQSACIWYAMATSMGMDSITINSSGGGSYFGFVLEFNNTYGNPDQISNGTGSGEPMVSPFQPISGGVVVAIATGPTGWSGSQGFSLLGNENWTSNAQFATDWALGNTTMVFTAEGNFTELAASFPPNGSGPVSPPAIDMHFTPHCSDADHCPPPPSRHCSPDESDLNNIRNASMMHAVYIRFDIWWNWVENDTGSFSTCAENYYREVLDNMSIQKLRAIAIVGTQEPAWAIGGVPLPGQPCNSTLEQQYASGYAQEVSSLYGDEIPLYQVGNELNTPQGAPKCSEDSATGYIEAIGRGLHQGTTHVFKTLVNIYADETFPLLPCGGLNDWEGTLDSWLQGAGNEINIVAIDHYPGFYCWGNWKSDGFLDSLHEVAVGNSKGYAVAESGYSVYGAAAASDQKNRAIDYLGFSYGYSCQSISGTCQRAADDRPAFIAYFRLTDPADGNWGSPECCFGLQTAQNVSRPAFRTVASYFYQLRGRHFDNVGYDQSFNASGLPDNAAWCIRLRVINPSNGHWKNYESQCKPPGQADYGTSKVFSTPPGTYSYEVYGIPCSPSYSKCRYVGIDGSGSNIVVGGNAWINFTVGSAPPQSVAISFTRTVQAHFEDGSLGMRHYPTHTRMAEFGIVSCTNRVTNRQQLLLQRLDWYGLRFLHWT